MQNEENMFNLLFIGDIIGRPGRQAISEILPELKRDLNLNLVIANGENLASGLGMTLETYHEMIDSGIDYFTSGNHIWDKKDFIPYLDDPTIKVIRPLNYPAGAPGRGYVKFNVNNRSILLVNLIGRAFFHESFDDPFKAIDALLKAEKADITIIDHHAEATSNKMIMGLYLDGRVEAVVGTHTHVPTNDAMILPKGTAYITDVGMVGPLYSSIGGDINTFTKAELTQLPFSYKVGSGDVVFSALHLVLDEKNQVKTISQIRRIIKKDTK